VANKKRRRPTQTKAASGPARAAAASTTPAVKVRPAEPGGPNRQERKEEARRQREAVRRRQARRRSYRVIAAVVAVLLAIAAVVILVQNNRKTTARALAAAGCGVVQTIKPYNATDDQAHIGAQGSTVTTPPPLSTYPSVPPVSGPHLPPGQQLSSGVYDSPPDIYGAIHSLEHGAVIIWYAPTAPSADVAKVATFYRSTTENDHVLVAPYNYPAQGPQGSLPAGKNMVMVAWHHLQVCNSVSVDAAKTFVSSFRVKTGVPAPAGWKGDAPEAGAAI
jgi:uncharacterized protein DUF3105